MASTDEQEVYDDGTAIKNISVAGVAQKAAMFEQKPGKTTPPVLRKLRQQQANTNAGGDSTSQSNQPEEKKTPPWVKKPVSNGTAAKPEVTPKSPVGSKPAPTIPKKTVANKWSPNHEKTPPTVFNKPSTFAKNQASNDTIPAFRKLSTDSNKTSNDPVLKDINHNVKTEPIVNSNITKDSKRASVTDMLKNFQSESKNPEPRITSVKPLKENTSPQELGQSEPVERRTSNVSTTSSIEDRVNALSKITGATITQKRKSVITRKKDNQGFKRVSITAKTDLGFGEPPPKPPKLTDVDLEPINQAYSNLLITHGITAPGGSTGGEDEELYDDIGNVVKQFSIIEPMTEEEEYDDIMNVMKSPSNDQETYDDCAVAPPVESDEIYEPLDEIDEAVSGGSVSSKSKESEKELAEKKKREEKERKEQEKRLKEEKKKKDREEKDRQKEIKKKEKEEKDRLKSLKVDGTEKKMGEGIVTEDSSGGKLDLTVKKGEQLIVMRMDKNPKGKWLVKNTEGKWGYVDSNNVEVATPTIRQWMNNDQECYMNPDVDENGIITEDVYEEL